MYVYVRALTSLTACLMASIKPVAISHTRGARHAAAHRQQQSVSREQVGLYQICTFVITPTFLVYLQVHSFDTRDG